MLDRIKRMFERRTHPANPDEWLLKLGLRPVASGIEVTQQTSLQCAAVYACVRVLAESVASLPLLLYRRLDNGGKERATGHSLYGLLHTLPNPEMTSIELRESLMGHLALWGNAYCEIEYARGGFVRGLWPLRPDRTSVKRVDGELVYVVMMPTGPEVVLANENVMHIRGLGYNGILGYSPIDLARQAIGLAMATEEFGARFFGNGAVPGGVLEYPGKLGEEAHDRLKKSWQRRHQGLENAQRIAILEEGMSYKEVGIPPDDAQFLETRKFQVPEIARFFRVPPHKLADLERATFCMPADVQVFTDCGPQSIADIQPGDAVWSLGEGGLELAKVKRAACTGDDDILEIRTTNRTVRANAQHRMLVRSKHPIPKQGRGQCERIEWVNEYIEAGELRVGDTIVTLDDLPAYGNARCETRETSVGFMEFCGLLLGDGNVRKGWGVSIARADNALYMDHYRHVIQEEFVSFGKRGNGRDRANTETEPVHLGEQARQTRFASVLAAEELDRLGFGGNARSKRVPGWVFGLEETLRLAFLRGYLDADGSVSKKGRISFHSVNEEMLSQIRHLCISVGVPVTNSRRQPVRTWLPNGKRFQGEIFTFTCSDPGANRRIWSNDPRYQQRLLAGKPFDRKGRKYPRYGGRAFDVNGCGLARITSIKKLPPEPVYDLEVDGSHSFVASGVIVHNSNIEHQSIEFVTDTLQPWLVRWEQAIYRDLLSQAERRSYFAEHLVAALLRGDTASRYQAYAVARQNGWMSANDIRELENMNPIDGGDVYLVPLNMIPAERASKETTAGQDGVRPVIPTNGREKRARDFGRNRLKLANSYQKVMLDSIGRVVRREVNDVRRAARKHLGKRDATQFGQWLDDFYRDHRDFWRDQMLPILLAYADQVGVTVADELNVDDLSSEHIGEFIDQYAEKMAAREANSSLLQLKRLLEDAITEGVDPLTSIETRLGEWEEKRPAKMAREESRNAGNAFAVALFAAGAIVASVIVKMMWVTNGDSCPYCSELEGRIVGIEEVFVEKGDEFQPDGAERPLSKRTNITHPPLHTGCDCGVVAVIE